MSQFIIKIEEKVREESEKFRERDGFDFWNEHIKYVVKNAQQLAHEKNTNEEIVVLSALLHDIALILEQGSREDHHLSGALIAEEMLSDIDYPKEKLEKVKTCIKNHRKPAKDNIDGTTEEKCLADADALSHLDNIPMLFHLAYGDMGLTTPEGREFVEKKLRKTFKKMSDETQKSQRERFENVIKTLIKK